MTRSLRKLVQCRKGAAAVDFALAAPVVALFLVGFLQIGMPGMAKAGLGQAVESGARYATIYPRPTDAQISAKILAGGYGMRWGRHRRTHFRPRDRRGRSLCRHHEDLSPDAGLRLLHSRSARADPHEARLPGLGL